MRMATALLRVTSVRSMLLVAKDGSKVAAVC